MTSETPQTTANGIDQLSTRLGYLLKHAHLRYAETSAEALAPLGLNGRELAALAVLAEDVPLSQLEAAGRLGVDRTTMVALVDTLEAKGLAERRRSPLDRRKNVVQLTEQGRTLLNDAEHVRLAAERRFLAPLPEEEAEALLRALRILTAIES
ncbi:MarR family transcriptional regulator [Kitasatospora acidiphila]|uniref:MarR family transcriptional regulator n=1 Tax=Kitasatospora acidiphila TaxID=2567942 RepID=A0A540VY69_9ACTN|nr:MarR family transcriptional regulator [Kitasatospora acidiphila]TQF01689.1 MarR family transcriptional regulator [Kitasatospora acidiphila]